jgi:hypothetical protein
MSMRTSETVAELGRYISECCGEEMIFDVGDVFQRCLKCQALCVWELEDEVVSYEEREPENGLAA